jgi:transposase
MAEVAFSAQGAATADSPGSGDGPPAIYRHAVSERGRRPKQPPSPSVQKPTRRCFTAEYKLRILREADQCTKPGELGTLLQREGLYSSHLCSWRRQREAAARAALAPKKRGRKPTRGDGLACQCQWLQCENRHLQARLRQAEMIIAMQAKVSVLLGISLGTPDAPAAQRASIDTALPSDGPDQTRGERGNSM